MALLTLMFGSFDPGMVYIDMKVAFETIYIMLSQSHTQRRFQAFIFVHLQKFPTNEPPCKWRGESQGSFTSGQGGKSMRVTI